MSVGSDRRLRWLSVVLLLSVLLGVGATVVGTVAVASAVATAAAGESILLVALRAALPYLLALATLTAVGAGALAWLVVRALRLARLPRSDRLARVARGLERVVPWLAERNLSERVAPTVEDRRETLVERYAAGELTEREFERELEALLAEEDAPTDWSATDVEDAFDRRFEADLRRDDHDDHVAREGATDDRAGAHRDAAEREPADADVDRDRR